MKKYIFLILSIFSLFFITDNVSALTFTASDGNTYQVDSLETLRDYCYYTYVKPNNYSLMVFSDYKSNRNDYYCYFGNANSYYYNASKLYFSSNITRLPIISSYGNAPYTLDTTSSVIQTQNFNNLMFSSIDIYSDNTYTVISRNANSYSEIESKYASKIYHTITYYLNNEVYDSYEVEEGSSHTLLEDYTDFNKYTHSFSGWQYDTENIDLTNITSDVEIRGTITEKEKTPVYLDLDFPIDKNDFYTLLVLQSVLIMLIFLKWCFPFKGGKDLK